MLRINRVWSEHGTNAFCVRRNNFGNIKLNFFLSSIFHHDTTMFAFIILLIMYTGAFWYVDDTAPKFTQIKDNSKNITYERTHLF